MGRRRHTQPANLQDTPIKRKDPTMKAVVTRVNSASVSIDGAVHGKIGKGFLILLGVGPDDTPALCRKLAEKEGC